MAGQVQDEAVVPAVGRLTVLVPSDAQGYGNSSYRITELIGPVFAYNAIAVSNSCHFDGID